MLRASWKNLLARKVSLALSALAIILGTAFVAGSLTFTDMLQSAFNGIVNGSVADVNVQPKGTGGMSVVERQLDQAAVDKVRRVDGVQSADGLVQSMDTYVLSKEGKLLTAGAPGIGANYVDAPAYGGQQGLILKSGHAPHGANEVVLDPTSLEKGGYRLGDTVKIVTSGKAGVVQPTIVGTAVWGSSGSTGGASYAIFDTPTAQKLLLDGKDAYNGIWVVAKPGVSPDELAKRVSAALPDGFEAVTGQELAKQVQQFIGQLTTAFNWFFLVFAGIALLVGIFLIVNTFAILVAQRTRELALFRAMGASRGQVTWSVVFEAFVVGLVGSTGGLLLGFGLALAIKGLFASIGLDLGGASMRLTPTALFWTYAVGLVITTLSSLAPAVRGAYVSPVAAMRGEVINSQDSTLARALWLLGRVFGFVLLAGGAALLLLGLFGSGVEYRGAYLGAGAVFILVAVALISPIIGRPALWLLGWLNAKVFGITGRLAELNAERNPRRTAATASALMIGVTVVTGIGLLASSLKASTEEAINRSIRTDFVVMNPAQAPFSPSIGDAMEKVDGVKAVYRLRFVPAKVDGKEAYLAAMQPQSFDKLLKQTMVTGSLADFTKDTILVEEQHAKAEGWHVGDRVPATINGQNVTVKVAGIFAYQKGAGMGSVMTTIDTLTSLGMRTTDSFLSVDAAAGADLGKVRTGLDRVVADMPLVTVSNAHEYAQSQAQSIDRLVLIVYALLALAIIIAILGIINTLGLSIVERTREIGLLRAVGLNKGQVRRMVILESITIALLGLGLGIGLGLLLGYACQRALADSGLDVLVLPWAQIAVSAVVALVVGVLAGLWPSVRATNLDVLKAIATE